MLRKSVILFLVLSLFSLYGCGNSGNTPTQPVNEEASGILSDYNAALINTYLQKIQDASENFYDEYYTTSPRIAYYSVMVKKISMGETMNPTTLITFISEPFVGPHITIGTDEITFSADYTGNIELKELKHIKSYALPDHLKDLEKKPIPDSYE